MLHFWVMKFKKYLHQTIVDGVALILLEIHNLKNAMFGLRIVKMKSLKPTCACRQVRPSGYFVWRMIEKQVIGLTCSDWTSALVRKVWASLETALRLLEVSAFPGQLSVINQVKRHSFILKYASSALQVLNVNPPCNVKWPNSRFSGERLERRSYQFSLEDSLPSMYKLNELE